MTALIFSGIAESAVGRVIYTGTGVEGRDARGRRGVWSGCTIIEFADEGSCGLMFVFSVFCAAGFATSALGEITKMSALGGRPWISKEVERGEGLGESPSWIVDAAGEPKATLVGVETMR